MSQIIHRHTSSFRDPSGFLFKKNNILYRQVNKTYQEHFDFFISSGLYKKLEENNKIIPHQQVEIEFADPLNGYCVIQPENLPFVSYPYEWCFNQLKDAALLTLDVQKTALEYEMTLKDASYFNVQFFDNKPIFIDTLSFEKYQEGTPWVAYRQFCQHFLAPLALMSCVDIRLNALLVNFIDGIPLDLTARLLPNKTRFNFGLLSHIFMHANAQKQYADKSVDHQKPKNHNAFSRMAFLGLIDSLESTIRKLTIKSIDTEWANYYHSTNYSTDSFASKKQIVAEYIDRIKPDIIWDLGANTGEFSHLTPDTCHTIAFDIDPGAVESHYHFCKEKHITHVLPLRLDLANPSPSIGWHHQERMSFLERGPADMVLALALIHHLTISNNVPLPALADFFKDTGKYLVIEFIPKSDSQIQKLLKSRIDIFDEYQQEHFEKEMQLHFQILDKKPVAGSERTLYLMERR